jgi:hypothetical protein
MKTQHLHSLKRPPPHPSSPPRTPAVDDVSVAASEISSSSPMTWKCPQCSYTNGDLSKENCAMCGIRDQNHIDVYQRAMKRHQPPVDDSSYRWFSSPDGKRSPLKGDNFPAGPPMETIETKNPPHEASLDMTPEKKVNFEKYPLPLTFTSSMETPPKIPTKRPQRVATPYVFTKQEQQEKLNMFRTMKTDDSLGSLATRTRPGRHGSFDEGEVNNQSPPSPPSKRPPRSAIPKGSTPTKPPSTPVVDQPYVAFSRNEIQSDQTAKQRRQRIRQASVTSSTAGVKSGMGGFFEAPSPASSSTLESFTGEDNSVSRVSCSSKSTVKVSNTTSNKIDSLLTPQKETARPRPSWGGQDEDISSLPPPRRSKSTPPEGSRADQNEDIVVAPPSLRAYRSSGSTGTPVGVILEDMEQSSIPFQDSPQMTEAVDTPAQNSRGFVPPKQLYFPLDSPGKPVSSKSREITFTSLEHTEKIPSVSSIASSTASTRYKTLLGVKMYNSQHGDNDISAVDFENQCGLMDENNDPSNGESLPRRKRSPPPFWVLMPVVVVAVVITFMAVFLSSATSSYQFETGITYHPTVAPNTPTPTTPPTNQLTTGDALNTDTQLPEVGEDPFENITNDEPGQNGLMYKVTQVLSESGADSEELGLSVAAGGNFRLAMLGRGFVRVVDWSSSYPSTLTWPIRPNDLVETGFGESSPVGNDINVTVGGWLEIPSIAMSANGERIAIVADAGLSVWEYVASDERWELIFSERIFKDGVKSIPYKALPTAVSMSDDGGLVAAGMVTATKDGHVLIVRIWDMDADMNDPAGAQFVKFLDQNHSFEDRDLTVELSSDGSVLAVCLRENIFVKAVGDVAVDSESFLDLGSGFEAEPFSDMTNFTGWTCGLSGDGNVLAISSRDTNDTFVYSFRQSAWELDGVLQAAGPYLSMNQSGKTVVVGGSSDVVTVWVQHENSNDYRLVHQLRNSGSGKTIGSLALTKEPLDDGRHFLAVGFPTGDGRVDIFETDAL